MLSQDITPVNDAPTSTNLSGDTATYTEQQALAALLDAGSNATVADVDSPNFDTGTLTVAITAGLVAAEDQLVIRTPGTVTFNADRGLGQRHPDRHLYRRRRRRRRRSSSPSMPTRPRPRWPS